MRAYEVMFVIRPDLEQEQDDAVVKRFSDQIERDGGKLVKTDIWGKRRLAYPIKHFEDGYYALVAFDAENPVIEELNRTMTISDDIIRFKIMRRES
ncbi:MAG: 30S ribosomal protein S6 [Candidatus Geothermincolia bacterium]